MNEIKMAEAALKRQHLAKDIRDLLICVGERDFKFKWGDTIRFTPSEVHDILLKYGSALNL